MRTLFISVRQESIYKNAIDMMIKLIFQKELQGQLKDMKTTVDQAKAVKKLNPKEEAQREAAIKAVEKENGN